MNIPQFKTEEEIREEFMEKVTKSKFDYDDWYKEIADFFFSQFSSRMEWLEERVKKMMIDGDQRGNAALSDVLSLINQVKGKK